MSEQTSNPAGSDQRNLTFDQSSKAGATYVTGQFLKEFGAMIYEVGRRGEAIDYEHQGWTMLWRQEPTPRIQIRRLEPKFHQLVKAALTALGYEVRDKDDHLVVIL